MTWGRVRPGGDVRGISVEKSHLKLVAPTVKLTVPEARPLSGARRGAPGRRSVDEAALIYAGSPPGGV